jgi:hypothetical protein
LNFSSRFKNQNRCQTWTPSRSSQLDRWEEGLTTPPFSTTSASHRWILGTSFKAAILCTYALTTAMRIQLSMISVALFARFVCFVLFVLFCFFVSSNCFNLIDPPALHNCAIAHCPISLSVTLLLLCLHASLCELPALHNCAIAHCPISLSVTLLLLCLHASLCELPAHLFSLALFNLFHSLTLFACSLSPTLFYSLFYSR